MFNLLIKKVGLPDGKLMLLIKATSMLFLLCFFGGRASAQSKLSAKDSAKFVVELKALLNKYGLPYTGFQIAVQSYNQSGGQTAFIINNNYRDLDYVPDSINFICEYVNEEKTQIRVSPKYGIWHSGFIAFPTNDNCVLDVYDSYGIWRGPRTVNEMMYDGKKSLIDVRNSDSSCGKDNPYYVNVESSNCFFIFGDCINCKDLNKVYIYNNGRVYCANCQM